MNNPPNEQSPTAAAQIAQIKGNLNQIQAILEAPEWSQKIYNRVSELESEIRITIVAIYSNPTATASHRRQAQGEFLQESNRLGTAANKRQKQHAIAL